MKPRHLKKLYYFTIEDESVIPEAFGKFEPDAYAVAYKVVGTDDVFVTTQDTRAVMDRHDLAYNLLAEEDSNNISVWHTELSREELAEYEEALRALALAFRSIAIACVGINGDRDLAAPLAAEPNRYTYFGAPGGHTFVLRLFATRDEAVAWAAERGEVIATWAATLPLASADELRTYH